MRAVVSALLCPLLVACGSSPAPELQALSEDQTGRAELDVALSVWQQAGLPDVAQCPLERWARVSPAVFREECGDVSCAAGRVGPCMVACTPLDDVSAPIGVWDVSLHPNDPGTESVARAHEQFHAWLWCATGDPDTDHRSAAWAALQARHRDLEQLDPTAS